MNKRLHVLLSFCMLAVVLFTALPKVYLHKLMGHRHTIEQLRTSGGDADLNTNTDTQNCSLEKFETPVYFTIFKFIQNCTPFRQHSAKVSDNYLQKNLQQQKTAVTWLRGPPMV